LLVQAPQAALKKATVCDRKGGSLSQEESNNVEWFALQVRSNLEKAVQLALRTKGYDEFLPLYHKRNRWSDRMRDVDLPLFPGYVFGRFTFNRRLPILTIPGVVRIVGIGRNPEPIDEAQLDAIRSLVTSGLPVAPWPFLQVGDRVIIEKGSLTGIEGILVQTKSQCRVVLSVDLLQRSVGVEIERDWIRPVPATQRPAPLRTLPQIA
jgi:transcription antitermination factor NusG